MSTAGVVITRVVNSCVLLEFGDTAVLTDPWFSERWHLHFGERPGLAIEDLPPLAAIVVSHGFVNHWDRRGLRRLPHKDATRVVVPSARLARQAEALGFRTVDHPSWGSDVQITEGVRLEVVAAHRSPLGRCNSYVVDAPGVRLFVGGEARDIDPLAEYGRAHPSVDVALLPVNGLRVPGAGRIVMGPAEAVDGARALTAPVLVPIHDAHAEDPIWRWIRRSGRAADAERIAAVRPGGPEVVDLTPGIPWSPPISGRPLTAPR